jgi:hypothetical protein
LQEVYSFFGRFSEVDSVSYENRRGGKKPEIAAARSYPEAAEIENR